MLKTTSIAVAAVGTAAVAGVAYAVTKFGGTKPVLQARMRAASWLSSAANRLAVLRPEHVIKVRRVMRVNGAGEVRP